MKRYAQVSTALGLVASLACGGDGGTGPDTTPPSVSSVSPAPGTTGVALGSDVVVTFSEAIAPATVTSTSVGLKLGGVDIPATLSLENSNRTVRLSPTAPLGNNSAYVLTVTGAITDPTGNALSGAPVTSGFTSATVNVTLSDLTGDTFGAGAFHPDVTTFSAQQGSVTVVIQFSAAIARWSANAANSVGGYVDIDADQDSTTGIETWVDVYRPGAGSTGMGEEFWVDLFDNPDGTFRVFNENDDSIGVVTPTFGATSITFTIPQSLLGNDDGNVNLAVLVGADTVATDIAPNDGHLTLGTSGLPRAPLARSLRRRASSATARSWGR